MIDLSLIRSFPDSIALGIQVALFFQIFTAFFCGLILLLFYPRNCIHKYVRLSILFSLIALSAYSFEYFIFITEIDLLIQIYTQAAIIRGLVGNLMVISILLAYIIVWKADSICEELSLCVAQKQYYLRDIEELEVLVKKSCLMTNTGSFRLDKLRDSQSNPKT